MKYHLVRFVETETADRPHARARIEMRQYFSKSAMVMDRPHARARIEMYTASVALESGDGPPSREGEN